MSNNDLPQLGDDQPKENPWEQDRLGYASFASRVAQTITRMHTPNGYVIGLHGRWGSGKSTALNFIKKHIEKHNEEIADQTEKLTIVDFRPWIVAGNQDLITAFFKVLAESLGDPDPWYKRWWKKILRLVRAGSDPLMDAVAKVGAAVDPSMGAAASASAGIARRTISFFTNRFLAEPSLQKTYENLKDQLKKDGRRFVATIDDLDRLQDDEVRAIMQMVKTIGRLPNLVYILVYDREIVGRALDGVVTEKDGPSFAEKIVQQELELPHPSKSALLGMLDQEVAFMGDRIPESERWLYIRVDGIHRWVRSPRDVVRYANAIKFSWPALEGEIDPADLFAIEGLKIFEPAAFYWIRDNRDFFFNEGQFSFAQEDLLTKTVDGLKRRFPEDRHQTLMRLMGVMFPQHLKAFQGPGAFGGSEMNPDLQLRRGIGSANGFDSYFGLHLAPGVISKTAVDALVEVIDNEENVQNFIDSYINRMSPKGSPMISDLLDEIRYRYNSRKPIKSSGSLLKVLLRTGEQILNMHDPEAFLLLSPAAKFSFLIDDILKGWSIDEASEQLISAFDQATSPAVLADVYVDRGRELDVFERGGRTSEPPRISGEAFNKIGTILLQRIQSTVADGTLNDAPAYYDIIRAWAHLAGPEAPKAWIQREMVESVEFFVKLARGLVSYSIGTKNRSYTMRELPDPVIFDASKLRSAAELHLKEASLSADQRALLTEIVEGSSRALKGLPPPVFSGDKDN